MAGIMDTLTRLLRGTQATEAPTTAGAVDYEAAATTNPDDPQAWFSLGAHYRVQGDPYKAVEALERAVSLRPDFADAHYMLGLAYADQGKVEQALQMFEVAARSTDNRMLNEYARRKIEELRGAQESG